MPVTRIWQEFLATYDNRENLQPPLSLYHTSGDFSLSSGLSPSHKQRFLGELSPIQYLRYEFH